MSGSAIVTNRSWQSLKPCTQQQQLSLTVSLMHSAMQWRIPEDLRRVGCPFPPVRDLGGGRPFPEKDELFT